MVVALQAWDLELPGCASLKDKRSVLRPLVAALRAQCNVSVAETGHQDRWQRAEIACVAVGGDRAVVQQVLQSADRLVERADGVRIIDTMLSWR